MSNGVVSDNTPEFIAFRLMERIASAEKKTSSPEPAPGATTADRQWTLDTYAECLEAVRGHRHVSQP